MNHHGDHNGEELARVILKPDGDTFEDRVEGESQEKHDAPQGGVVELENIRV